MVSPALGPLATIVIISPAGSKTLLTDSLNVSNIPFRRSLSEMMETISLTIPGDHWYDPTKIWKIAVEYQSRVLLYGLVGNCTVTYEGGLVTTTIEAIDMCHRLSHLLVPIYLPVGEKFADYGMCGPCTFAGKRIDEIVTYLLGGAGWMSETFIRPGDYIAEVPSSTYIVNFDWGTTRLEAIQKLADEYKQLFFLLYSKEGPFYYADAFFDSEVTEDLPV